VKKIISIILCSSFFILNGGRTLPIKHNSKHRLYRNFNNAFYAITHAKGKIKKPKTKNSERYVGTYVGIKDEIYSDIQNVAEYFKIAQQEINRTPQLKLLKKDIDHLKNLTNAIIERGKKFSIPKSDLRRKFGIIKDDTIDIMFKLAIRYQYARLEKTT
jgi:hypothetical protein